MARFCEHGNETSVSAKGGAFFDKPWELPVTEEGLCSVQLVVDCPVRQTDPVLRNCTMSLLQCPQLADCT